MRAGPLALLLASCATAAPPRRVKPPVAASRPAGDLASLHRQASDATEPLEARRRAVAKIAATPSGDVTGALQSLATDVRVAPEVRAAAAVGLAQRAGASAVDTLTGLLDDGDARVRLAAARGLGMVGGDAARAALQARLDVEADPAVREQLQRSLAQSTN